MISGYDGRKAYPYYRAEDIIPVLEREMPARASWKMLIAVACLGGIGFTMSIFVDTLSFGEQAPEVMSKLRDMGKVAVLMGSLCAGLLGSLLITFVNKLEKR